MKKTEREMEEEGEVNEMVVEGGRGRGRGEREGGGEHNQPSKVPTNVRGKISVKFYILTELHFLGAKRPLKIALSVITENAYCSAKHFL